MSCHISQSTVVATPNCRMGNQVKLCAQEGRKDGLVNK